MNRYFETFLRRKEVFLIPIIIVPIMALVLFFGRGPQYAVKTSIWVDWAKTVDPVSSSKVNPNTLQAQGMKDWLATEDFKQELMDRVGLTGAISQGQWPVPSPIQRATGQFGMGRIVGIGSILKSMGLALPTSAGEAVVYGHSMISKTVKVTPVGNNLLSISYKGSEPILGKRLVEETILLYNQKTQDLETASGRNQTFRVIDPPSAATTSTLRSLMMTIIMGMIVGIVFSFAWGFVTTWTDGTVRNLDDVQRAVNAPLFVQIPAMPADKGQPQDVARLTTARWYAEKDA